jgi:hypothetical protein
MSMASIDKATAELRWQGYEISGDGRLAVVYECCRKVVLVQTPLEASVLQQERCGQNCSYRISPEGGWHAVKELDRPRPATLPVWQSHVWERD